MNNVTHKDRRTFFDELNINTTLTQTMIQRNEKKKTWISCLLLVSVLWRYYSCSFAHSSTVTDFHIFLKKIAPINSNTHIFENVTEYFFQLTRISFGDHKQQSNIELS